MMNELLHPVTLDIANWDAKPRKTAWSYDGKAGGELKLAPGLNRMQVGIPEGYDGRRVRFALRTPDGDRSVETEILPAERWTVYLVQHTHTDIGYTKPQTEILTEHLRYIDYAIEYCEATADYPDDAKFRWTCEASWAVREWLRIRPAEQVERFLRFVKNGQIEVTAMFFNMSELSGENAYKTFLAPIARFHELGIPVETAMQDDVNGVAWCLADYLPDVGVKYLSMGSNGHRALIPFDRPTLYRWESPSGKSLLSFRADHYMTANFWGIDRGDMEGVRNGVFSYIRSLRRSGYDFPLVAAQYSGYSTDNSPPSMQECALIRDWNEHYAWPRLRSATVHEFLEQINTKYGDRLPVYRAAYPDWWTDGFGSAARETAASRKTQSDMIAIGGMLSMAGMAGDRGVEGTHDELRRIHENLLFYDEHTFGAAESISDPQCENSQVQWAEKGSYVWEALKSAQMLLRNLDRPASGRPAPFGASYADLLQSAGLGALGADDRLYRLRGDPARPSLPSARRTGPRTLRRTDPFAQRGALLRRLGRPDSGDGLQDLRGGARRGPSRRTRGLRAGGSCGRERLLPAGIRSPDGRHPLARGQGTGVGAGRWRCRMETGRLHLRVARG